LTVLPARLRPQDGFAAKGPPRASFTVRRLMAGVAIVAVVLGFSRWAWGLKDSRDLYLHLANAHYQVMQNVSMSRRDAERMVSGEKEFVRSLREMIAQRHPAARLYFLERQIAEGDNRARRLESEAGRAARRARYHEQLISKYTRASGRPWRHVEPDGPAPPWP
jgi:hypothetical protein